MLRLLAWALGWSCYPLEFSKKDRVFLPWLSSWSSELICFAKRSKKGDLSLCSHRAKSQASTFECWIAGVSHLKVDIDLSWWWIVMPLSFPLPSNDPTITKLLHTSAGGEILFGNNLQPQIIEEFGDDIFILPPVKLRFFLLSDWKIHPRGYLQWDFQNV